MLSNSFTFCSPLFIYVLWVFSLKNHFKLLENLKRKDPPILTNDEIIAATEEVERLTNFFNEDIATAKVTDNYYIINLLFFNLVFKHMLYLIY